MSLFHLHVLSLTLFLFLSLKPTRYYCISFRLTLNYTICKLSSLTA